MQILERPSNFRLFLASQADVFRILKSWTRPHPLGIYIYGEILAVWFYTDRFRSRHHSPISITPGNRHQDCMIQLRALFQHVLTEISYSSIIISLLLSVSLTPNGLESSSTRLEKGHLHLSCRPW